MGSKATAQTRSQRRNKRKKKLKTNNAQQQHNPTISRETKPSFWDLDFESERFKYWKSENEPYLQVWEDNGSEPSPVRFFMTESGAAYRIMPEVEVVANFCSDNALEEVRSGNSLVTQENVAFLDDRTNDGTNSVSRGCPRPLNAHTLYLELRKKRFHFQYDEMAGRYDDTTSQKGGQAPQLNADRRLLFITDLNRWTMMALISTVSISQARALRERFYRHLAFRGFIGAVYPPDGFPTFQLAFDLPYYALRTAPRRRRPQDGRKMADGSTVRKVTDLSFLLRRPKDSTPLLDVDYLCEAQITVLITGLDPWRWVAYCFVDTYFEHEHKRESVDDYYADREIDEVTRLGFQPDPFTTGESDANLPLLDPREFFLAVLNRRIQQVGDEWHALVTGLERRINTYIATCPFTAIDVPSPTPGNPLAVRQSRSWVVETRKLLRLLTQKLTATVNHLESFRSDETFTTVTGRASNYIPTICANIKQLGTFLEELKFLDQNCHDYNDGLSFYLNHEGTRDANIQARIAGFGQVMTFVMLCVISPIALAAGVLSMQEKAIPAPLGPNSTSFVVLVAILMGLVWTAVGTMLNWERIKHAILDFINPALYDRDLEGQQE